MAAQELLPDCKLRAPKKLLFVNGQVWVPIFCANCGRDGGRVLENEMDFAFYLCDPCGEKWAPMAGTYAMPDEVFWQKVKDAQLEAYGRELTAVEVLRELDKPDSPLAKLARERS